MIVTSRDGRKTWLWWGDNGRTQKPNGEVKWHHFACLFRQFFKMLANMCLYNLYSFVSIMLLSIMFPIIQEFVSDILWSLLPPDMQTICKPRNRSSRPTHFPPLLQGTQAKQGHRQGGFARPSATHHSQTLLTTARLLEIVAIQPGIMPIIHHYTMIYPWYTHYTHGRFCAGFHGKWKSFMKDGWWWILFMETWWTWTAMDLCEPLWTWTHVNNSYPYLSKLIEVHKGS